MGYRGGARGTRRSLSKRASIRLIALAVVASFVVTAAVAGTASDAFAKDSYPTYSDLQAAKNSAAKKAALVKRIKGTISGLNDAVASTQKKEQKSGDAAQDADQKYQVQNLKAVALQAQADAAKADAAAAREAAGELLVQQYRSSGNSDTTLTLLLNASDSKNILYSLGMSKDLVDQAQSIFEEATQKKNTAQSLSDQAAVAQTQLGKLKKVSDEKLALATKAADAAAKALKAQQDEQAAQQALLKAAESKVATTQKQYNKGVAALAAAQAKAAEVGGPALATAVPKVVGDWSGPEVGPITANFGWRVNPFGGGQEFHLGTDIGAA